MLIEKMVKPGYGSFGNLAATYDKIRRDYPDEVIEFVLSFLPKTGNQKILDLGCGTGISTKRIFKKLKSGEVIGCDKDPAMLSTARNHSEKIRYIEALAEKLPFNNGNFGIVTCFESFHWFNNTQALKEIRRTLSNRGVFIAINKYGINRFKTILKETVADALNGQMLDVRKNYEPKVSMGKRGFRQVLEQQFKQTEIYTVEEAVERYHSTSVSNLVPENLKEHVDNILREKYSREFHDGSVKREVEIKVVVGKK